MRILYYIPGNTYGGAHNQVVRLAGPLREAGYDPVVLIADEPGDGYDRLVAAGVETYRAALLRPRATRRISTNWAVVRGFGPQVRRLARFLREQRIDLIQLHGVLSVDGALAARRSKVPVVWQILDTRAPRAVRLATAPFVQRYADAVLVTGTTVGSLYPGLQRFGDRLVPYYPPVSAAEFTPPDEAARRAVRARLGVTDDEILVGDLGNLNAQKGHQYVVEAVGRLRRRLPQVTLRVRGGRAAGHERYEASVEDLAGSYGLPSDTVGQLADGMDSAAFLSALDLFAVGSEPRSEGVPTAIIEAMLTGVPVVASDVGGVAEAVRDGETGFCVPPRDVGAMEDRLERLIADPELRRTMGERSRAVAAAELSLESCIEAHLRAYRAAVEHGRGRRWPARG